MTPEEEKVTGEKDTIPTPSGIPQNKPERESSVPQKKETSNFQAKQTSWIKPLRTYKSDLARAMKERGGSLTKIILAEREKKEKKEKRIIKEKEVVKEKDVIKRGKEKRIIKEKKVIISQDTPTTPVSKKNIYFAIGGVLLLVIGISSIVYVFMAKEDVVSPEYLILSKNIIFMEEIKKITLTQYTKLELTQKIASEIRGTALSINKIENIYITKKETSIIPETFEEKTLETIISFKELLEILKSKAPSSLLRAIDETFIFGIHSFVKNNPFLLLNIKGYPNAFSGMLGWEKTLASDLAPLFDINNFSSENYKDEILSNQDTRTLRNKDGDIVLLYAFANQEILIITIHETTLDEILERLKRPNKVLR